LGFGRVVGWDEPGVAVGAEVDPPAIVVNQGVVAPAKQHPVVDAGGAPGAPRCDVVGIGRVRWSV